MANQKPLTQTDWIIAAFRALTKGGPQAIRAETIARDLKVSKGSFYWHFKDVPAFKVAMIDHWQQVATDAVIMAVNASTGTAQSRLFDLMAFATSDAASTYGGPQSEAAIRDWGRYDTAVNAAVQDVDLKRMGYVDGLFGECGFSGATAAQKSRQLYYGLIGLQHVTGTTNVTAPDDLTNLLATLLAGGD